MTPVRAFHIGPPLIMIVEWNFLIRRREHDCTSYEILLGRSWELLFCWFAFSDGDVIRRLNELLKLRVCDRSRIHPKAIHINTMHRLGIVRGHRHFMTSFPVYDCTHGKLAAGDPDHPFRCFVWRSRFIKQCWLECGTTLLGVDPSCESRAETNNRDQAKNDWPHFSLRSLLRYLLRFPQFSCQPRLSLKASYLWSPFRFCR